LESLPWSIADAEFLLASAGFVETVAQNDGGLKRDLQNSGILQLGGLPIGSAPAKLNKMRPADFLP
jgi:hypothetical protein